MMGSGEVCRNRDVDFTLGGECFFVFSATLFSKGAIVGVTLDSRKAGTAVCRLSVNAARLLCRRLRHTQLAAAGDRFATRAPLT